MTRRRLLTLPVLWFLAGVLLEAHLPGEPLHWRITLVVLFFDAFILGLLHHNTTRRFCSCERDRP